MSNTMTPEQALRRLTGSHQPRANLPETEHAVGVLTQLLANAQSNAVMVVDLTNRLAEAEERISALEERLKAQPEAE